jgi:hypothetical protein
MKRNLLALLLLTAFLLPSGLLAQTTAKVASVESKPVVKTAPAETKTVVKITPAERKTVEGVTANQLKSYLYFVASDAMQGRDTPSQGLDITAEFIRMNLERWGFKPAGDDGTFFQKIALVSETADPIATKVSIGDQSFTFGEDFARLAGNRASEGGMAPISAPVVFAGNGWMIKPKNLNPYAGVDIKGKFVAVYSEGQPSNRFPVPMPQGVTQADLTGTRGTDWADVVTYAQANGAAGVIILPSKFLAENWDQVKQMFGRRRLVVDKLRPQRTGTSAPNIFAASPKFAKALFAGAQGDPLAGYTTSFDTGKTINLNLVQKGETQWTQNVVAIWEGSDPVLKNEMVAIGAHYDHIGINPNAPGPDKISNGADDDGSGTVSVLSIAEALSHAPKRPKRSVLFVWHCGEEKGLWGSEYFNKFPTVDIKKVIAQLNIDMIGRSKKVGDTNPKNKDLTGENDIYVIGKDMMSSTLASIVDGTNKSYLNLGYDTRYDDPKDTNRFFFRSDHFNYALNGIPITFWFDGVHEDYHQVGDSPDKIDYQKMEKVARTIMLTLLELTDLKDRPKIDKQLPAELTQR